MPLLNANPRVSAPLSFGRHLAALLALTLVTPGVWAANIFDDNWQPPRAATKPAEVTPTPPIQPPPPVTPITPKPAIGNSAEPVLPTHVAATGPKPIPATAEQAKVRVLFKEVYAKQ